MQDPAERPFEAAVAGKGSRERSMLGRRGGERKLGQRNGRRDSETAGNR